MTDNRGGRPAAEAEVSPAPKSTMARGTALPRFFETIHNKPITHK